jgi:hypothetical protein
MDILSENIVKLMQKSESCVEKTLNLKEQLLKTANTT